MTAITIALDTATSRAMEKSPLAKLPPELRNQIAELVFSDIAIELKQEENSTRFRLNSASGRTALALTQTCKQLHAQTHKLFYSVANFVIYADIPTFSYTVNDFLRSLHNDAAERIKQVMVRCDAGNTVNLQERNSLHHRPFANLIGHALFQMQQPCKVRIYLELSYTMQRDPGWLQERIETTVIELDSGDLKRSWEDAKWTNEELGEVASEMDMDVDSCIALMDKLDLD